MTDERRHALEGSVRAILGPVAMHWTATRLRIELGDTDRTIAYQQLKALADAFGTTDIQLEYEASTPDWSDVTPGDPGDAALIIEVPP